MAGNFLENATTWNGAVETMPVFPNFKNIIATTTGSATLSTVKSGAGFLNTVVINSTTAGVITIYDNTAASGTKIATLKASIVEGTYNFKCKFSIGLWIDNASNSNLTITYR